VSRAGDGVGSTEFVPSQPWRPVVTAGLYLDSVCTGTKLRGGHKERSVRLKNRRYVLGIHKSVVCNHLPLLENGDFQRYRGGVPSTGGRDYLDVAGQELMTADRVTLRMNANVVFRIADARKSVDGSQDSRAALYREAQLALRAVVGTRELDTLLEDKDALTAALVGALRPRATDLGLELIAFGLRDIILPGEMKELLNRVTEARTAAEAAALTRREETATMRHQANTARLIESNPTLMRMRELEVIEKIAQTTNLQVVLGEKGLAERVVNLL